MPLQCLTCGGVYSPVSADGSSYFHACAPVVDPVTGAATVRANTRNENPPPAAVLDAQLKALVPTSDPNYWAKVNAASAVAMVSAGAGVKVV